MQFSTLQLEEMLREKGIDPETLPSKEHDEMLKVLMCNGGGGGLPSGGEPYKQLVTNGSGETVWEDRLAYKEEYPAIDMTGKESEMESVNVTYTAINARPTLTYYKLSDLTPSSELVQTAGDIFTYMYAYTNCIATSSASPAYIVAYDKDINVEYLNDGETISLPSAGIWGESEYLTFPALETIKPIDPEYIPPIKASWNDLTDKPFGEEVKFNEYSSLTEDDFRKVEDCLYVGSGRYMPGGESDTNKIVFNGTEYIVTAKDWKYGNASLKDETAENTGEPFYFYSTYDDMSGQDSLWICTSEPMETLAVYGGEKRVKRMDGNFIELTSPGGFRYVLEVSDDGTLSAKDVTNL